MDMSGHLMLGVVWTQCCMIIIFIKLLQVLDPVDHGCINGNQPLAHPPPLPSTHAQQLFQSFGRLLDPGYECHNAGIVYIVHWTGVKIQTPGTQLHYCCSFIWYREGTLFRIWNLPEEKNRKETCLNRTSMPHTIHVSIYLVIWILRSLSRLKPWEDHHYS